MNDKNILQDYINGESLKTVSTKYKISITVLKDILIKNNIHIRTAGEQTAIRNQKNRIKINDNYFSELTLENCYYLGFLAADGTVRKDRNEIKIGLNQEDKNFLEEFANKLNYQGELHYYSSNDSVELRFSSAQIKNDISKYSIVPRKTYSGISLINIPDKYKLAFIKGYFDGDGSFSFNKDTKQCAVKFVSHTKEILEEIKNFLPYKSHLYCDNRKLFSLELSTMPSLNFLQTIYNLDTPKLQRKYDKYLEALTLRIK